MDYPNTENTLLLGLQDTRQTPSDVQANGMGSREDRAAAELAEAEDEWRKQCIDFSIKANTSLLKDQGILITGGASGLGAAFARAFASAGAYVVVLDMNDEAGTAIEKELGGSNFHVKYVNCDVTSYSSQLSAFKTAMAFPPSKSLAHVLANAGVRGAQFPFPSDKDYDVSSDPREPLLTQINVSLIGLYYTTYLATHFMGANPANGSQSDRSILLTGSLLSYRGAWRGVDYCAAKHGIRGIFKSLRWALKKECGLRINMLAPTFILTPLTQPIYERTKDNIPYASVESVVDTVLRLISDTNIDGRAVCVGVDGPFDIRDDPEGLSGGLTMRDYVKNGGVPVQGA